MAPSVLPGYALASRSTQSAQPSTNTPLKVWIALEAYRQWAVNIIDFRDADHVMTRFALLTRFPSIILRTLLESIETGLLNPSVMLCGALSSPNCCWPTVPRVICIKDTANDNGANPARSTRRAIPTPTTISIAFHKALCFSELMSPRTTSLQADNSLQAANIPSAASSLYTTGWQRQSGAESRRSPTKRHYEISGVAWRSQTAYMQ
ncbi:MAG: hypothetical protein R3C56_12915 [Pirellulaceae bacterium]